MPERARNKSARQEREKVKESQKFHPIFPQNEVFRRVKRVPERKKERQTRARNGQREQEKSKRMLEARREPERRADLPRKWTSKEFTC